MKHVYDIIKVEEEEFFRIKEFGDYLRDNSNPLKLYTYNNDYKTWVDVINKTYPVGFWRISQLNK